MLRFISISLLLIIAFITNAQSDTLNQIDSIGKKQGYWIVYGSSRPDRGWCDTCKIEEGTYLDNKKEGQWIRYHADGVTPRLRAIFSNGRPGGVYEKFYPNGNIMEEGVYSDRKFKGVFRRYHESGCLAQEKYYNENGREDGINTFYYNDCDKSLDNKGSVEVRYKSINGIRIDTLYRYYPNGDLKQIIVYDTLGKVTSEDDYDRTNPPLFPPPSKKEKDAKPKKRPDKRSCNEINKNGELNFDGECRDGKPWNGNFYIYDSDGILIKIEIWKEGKYHADGQLK